MKKLTLISLISLITLIFFSKAVVSSYGKENNKSEVKIETKHDKNKVKIENKIESEDENENKNRVKIKIENDKGEFKIWGPIQSFDNSSLTIDGKTIKIDPNITKKFKQVGELKVNMYAKAEGVIINDNYYAEEIVVDNRNKKDISPTPTVIENISTTPSITNTPVVSTSPTVTLSETPFITPTTTETPLLQGLNNNPFILDQLILKLEKLISSLLKSSN